MNAAVVEGEVLSGINTIYTVRTPETELVCRIKGKKLREAERSYNPIAPGDRVEVLPNPLDAREGLIRAVRPRTTRLVRWNKKGRAPQLLAANAELAVCITTPQSPPFRPRFVDRLIVAAEAGGLRPIVVLNKIDLGCPEDTSQRLDHYRRMGYEVLRCSAWTGEGLAELSGLLAGRLSVLVGQSGVGKSSLLNALGPDLDLRTGEVSRKHDRGSHTTNHAVLLHIGTSLRVIDTPGVRELELAELLPEEVGFHFRDFLPHAHACAYQPCLHDEEPNCGVTSAVQRGEIHADRYESYLRIIQDLREARSRRRG